MGVIQFHDGSIYRFGPITDQQWVETFLLVEDPGCTWNDHWRDRHPTRWTKLTKWPGDLILDFSAVP
jgi:hypothetical protein